MPHVSLSVAVRHVPHLQKLKQEVVQPEGNVFAELAYDYGYGHGHKHGK
jgi:hypothetical protein